MTHFYLDDTQHRVAIPRGTDKTMVWEEELTTNRGKLLEMTRRFCSE